MRKNKSKQKQKRDKIKRADKTLIISNFIRSFLI